VNVDHAGSPYRKDVEFDLRDPLPWTLCSVASVYAGHVLEHLAYDEARSLLTRLLPCMVPGGEIMVVGPDVQVAEALVASGMFDSTYHTLEVIKKGGCAYDGDEHLWECTVGKVLKLLRDSGWVEIEDVGIENVSEFWPVADRKPPWQCAVNAVAP
jgi:hypothetical protein